jgi:ATP-binding protein involved in chromosome partitioning
MVQIQDNVTAAQQKENPQKAQDEAIAASLAKIKQKLIVMSGKGGVGKTSVSVNLSLALAKKGFKVGLMDVDIHGPDVPRVLGLEGTLELGPDQKLTPLRHSDNLSAVSIEALTPGKDDAIIWRGPLKFSAIRQFISHVAWGDLDYLIIDAPPGTGDEPLTVAQTITDAKAIIVTTPQEIALADVRKSINFCRQVKMEIRGLVENMSGYQCPHCGETIDLFGQGGGARTAKEMNVPFLGAIPIDPNVVRLSDVGKSILDQDPDAPVSRAFYAVADQLATDG